MQDTNSVDCRQASDAAHGAETQRWGADIHRLKRLALPWVFKTTSLNAFCLAFSIPSTHLPPNPTDQRQLLISHPLIPHTRLPFPDMTAREP